MGNDEAHLHSAKNHKHMLSARAHDCSRSCSCSAVRSAFTMQYHMTHTHEKAQMYWAITRCIVQCHNQCSLPESCAATSPATFTSKRLLSQQSFLLSRPKDSMATDKFGTVLIE